MNFRILLQISVAGASLLCAAGNNAFAQAASGSPEAADAQTASGNGGIADIIVTARKREESAQRVPVSITNLNPEQIAQRGITKPEDLGRFVPGLVFRSSSASASANFSLRGQVSSDIVLTVAPAVGIYEDNGNIPHPVGLNSALFDLERVEVLKGPQGTLYGRNTTGGAVNFITKGADFNDEHGFLTVELGNYKSRRLAGAINVPLVDNVLALRLSGQHWSRDGYGKSLVTGQRYGGDRDDDALRGSLLFTPNERITSKTKLEYTHSDRAGSFGTLLAVPAGGNALIEAGLASGCATSIANITPPSATRPNLLFNLATATGFAACAGAALSKVVNNGSLFTNYADVIASERATTWHGVEDLTIDLSDDVQIRSITSYHKASLTNLQDVDSSPFQILETYAGVGGLQPGARYVSDGVNPIPGGTSVLPKGTAVSFPFQFPIPLKPSQSYRQWTQEFNLSGKAVDDRLSWLIGAFGSHDKGHGSEPSIAFDILTGGGINATSNTLSVISKSWGIYTQEDFKFTDQISITGGLRYSKEFQDLRSQPFNWSATTGAFTCASVPPAANVPAPGNNPNACGIVKNSIRADGISYLASLNFQATPDILLYAKTSRGFRGGSLQLRTAYLPGSQPETATDYEIGLKSEFFDRRLRFNFAGYHTTINNKQETKIVPVCTDTSNPACAATQTIIFNAAQARVNGFEAEALAVPVRGLTLSGTLAMIDSKYLRWPDAPDQNSTTGGTFNAAGLPFREPKWQYTLGARYEHEVGPGTLSGSLDWAWQSRFHVTRLQFPSGVFDPDLIRRVTAARGLLAGRIDYNVPSLGIVFAVQATNLLDEKYQTTGLFSRSLGVGTGTTAEPRMVWFSITKKFGRE